MLHLVSASMFPYSMKVLKTRPDSLVTGDAVPVLRLGTHPKMERPAILNRSMPSTSGATMSIPAFQGRPSSAFQRFVNLSIGTQFTRLGKSIPGGERFYQW